MINGIDETIQFSWILIEVVTIYTELYLQSKFENDYEIHFAHTMLTEKNGRSEFEFAQIKEQEEETATNVNESIIHVNSISIVKCFCIFYHNTWIWMLCNGYQHGKWTWWAKFKLQSSLLKYP